MRCHPLTRGKTSVLGTLGLVQKWEFVVTNSWLNGIFTVHVVTCKNSQPNVKMYVDRKIHFTR